MDKKEFMELRNLLQQFEEEHSLELLTNNESKALMTMISVATDYITHIDDSMLTEDEKAMVKLGV